MSHTNVDQCRGKNSERCHPRLAEGFDQVHADEKLQRGGYAGAGPSAQGAFSSGGHPPSGSLLCDPSAESTRKKKQCVLLPARQLKNLFSEVFTN